MERCLSGEEPLTGRARSLSDVACGLKAICGCAGRSWIPARREGVLEANRVFSPFNQGMFWASETKDREDPTPPNALVEKAAQRKAMSDGQRSLPALDPAASRLY
jgi:hypothetical protein